MIFDLLADEFSTTWSMPWQLIVLRLSGSILLCGVIGFEREISKRPAGLRTHMLVGLAATVYTLMMLYLVNTADQFSDKVGMDPVRIIEAITTGVAFLAAGIIVFTRGEIQGLTTGASMWLAAAVGTSVGLGLWFMAFATTIIALTIIILLRRFEEKVIQTND